MIHANVKPTGDGCAVETSTDGAGWKTQLRCWSGDGDARAEGERIVRIMGIAWDYAGVEWRATSHGVELRRF